MLKVCCNICLKHLPNVSPDSAHFCERCSPFGEEYFKEVQKLDIEHRGELQRKLNKLREQFLHQRVVPKDRQQSLKAV